MENLEEGVKNDEIPKNKKKNFDYETDLLKYNFDYSTKFNSSGLDANIKDIFLQNIFLMSSKINLFNKIECLYKLNEIYAKGANNTQIYYITYKLIDYLKKNIITKVYINLDSLFRQSFLSEQNNYYYAFKCYNMIKRYFTDDYFNTPVNKDINEFICMKIDNFEKVFAKAYDLKYIKNISLVIDKILDDKKNIQEDNEKKEQNLDKEKNDKKESNEDIKSNQNLIEDENNSEYLYFINKIWLENAKSFIDNYIIATEAQILPAFFKDAFTKSYTAQAYFFNEKIRTIPKIYGFFPFPGPIDNFELMYYKDIWYDPVEKDENELIRKDLTLGKDYYLICEKDWEQLQNSFSFSNIIKRRKNQIDMVSFSVHIFDKRLLKLKNKSIDIFKKRKIQIKKKIDHRTIIPKNIKMC